MLLESSRTKTLILKLPPRVLETLRTRGYSDAQIAAMTTKELTDEYSAWHGIFPLDFVEMDIAALTILDEH